MASLLQPDRVIYLVRGEKKIRAPLSQLYFCRYCSELRSLECVSHEVSIFSTFSLTQQFDGYDRRLIR
ncbi:dynactin subunit 4 isoform X1, partial [Tachysurus ichikawai]